MTQTDSPATRLLPNICTDRMEETRDFYINLLGVVVGIEHEGWYLQLASPVKPNLRIGIPRQDHAFTPTEFQLPAQGVVLSVEVDDVDAMHEKVRNNGIPVALELREEDFGMRNFMVARPNGLLVNFFHFADQTRQRQEGLGADHDYQRRRMRPS